MRHAGSFVVTMMLAALPLYACAAGEAIESDAGPPPVEGGTVQPTAADVHVNVRDGFVSEAQWMRSYGVSALANGPDARASFDRLNAAQAQIVQQVAPFAGDDRAAQLNDLLHARAAAFADLVTSINSHASSTVGDPQAALDANAQQIGAFFAALCPNAFPSNGGDYLQAANRSMVEGLRANAGNDPAGGVEHFDDAQGSSVHFADLVGIGLSSTFHAELAPATTSRHDDDLEQALHVFFGDQVFWTRAYVVDHIADVATQPELDRAVFATVDLGNVLSSYFGETIGSQMQGYIHTDTTDALAFVFALETNDQNTIDAISTQWDADADTLALYVSTEAGVDRNAAQRLLRASVSRERAMIEAREAKQWDAEAANYQMVLESRNEFASLFAKSIAALPAQR